jgi:signal transduction histidine kinase
MNLISNKSEIQVEIIDFGIGIPEEDQQKLFNTFYRASNEGITGTGLGLYIVKTFIEKTRYNRVRKPTWKGLKQHCDYPI